MRSALFVALGLALARAAAHSNATENASTGASANTSVVQDGQWSKKAETPQPGKLPVPWKDMAARLKKVTPKHKSEPKKAPKPANHRSLTPTKATKAPAPPKAHNKVPDEAELTKYERKKHQAQLDADVNEHYEESKQHLAQMPEPSPKPSPVTHQIYEEGAIDELRNKTANQSSDVVKFAKFLGKTKAFMNSISNHSAEGLSKLEGDLAAKPHKKHKLPNSQMHHHSNKLEDRRHGTFYYPAPKEGK